MAATDLSPPPEQLLPDFIIAGAMKSGTTSIHYILDSHPRVFIPRQELHFFDMDNLVQHPDFFVFDGREWRYPAPGLRRGEQWAWYSSFFEAAEAGQMLGEDSTTYLASLKAPERIAATGKPIKIIVVLRDPADRAWSNYWHRVRAGRVTRSFEDTIQYEPASILSRSLYLEQVRNFQRHIPPERLHVVVFEQFIRDIDGHMQAICAYLGLDPALLVFTDTQSHANQSRWPRYPELQLWRNRLLRNQATLRYRDHLAGGAAEVETEPSTAGRLLDRLHRAVNPLQRDKRPRMNPQTRRMLDDYFAEQNRGLDEIAGTDLGEVWYHSRRTG